MKIKVCGLTRVEDIEAANEAAPDYIGFVFAKRSRRYVTVEQAAILKGNLSSKIQAVGVFVNESIESILELVGRRTIDMVQLHGDEDVTFMEELKRRGNVCVIKAVSMTSDTFERELKCWEESCVDFLLLDSGKGGTGEQFDYGRIGHLSKPFFLAGGLAPENVENAALQVRPYGIDMSSGVETDGYKDKEKIKEAVRRIRDVEGKIR